MDNKLSLYNTKRAKIALLRIQGPEFLRELRILIENILAKVPVDRYFIVGLGGSPAPVIAGIQAHGIREAMSLPLSIPQMLYGDFHGRTLEALGPMRSPPISLNFCRKPKI